MPDTLAGAAGAGTITVGGVGAAGSDGAVGDRPQVVAVITTEIARMVATAV